MAELRTWSRIAATALSAFGAAPGPWLDLAIRLWLAQAFPVVQAHEMVAPSPAGRIALLFARCANAAELQTLASHAVNRQIYTFNG